jgi:NAD kinase
MTERRTDTKIVLIVRRTRLDDLVVRFNTEQQARFYVEHLGADFSDYQAEHRNYRQAVRETEAALAQLGRVQVVDRSFLPNFIFGPGDTVVALGQDGLVANLLKYLDRQPVIGVNPDPARWEGVLLPFTVADLPRIVPEVFAARRRLREVTMAQAQLNTGEILFGVNDLFIGPRSHTSARYAIAFDGRSEQQSSSGIIVSTGLGSSGWFRSIVTGAAGIAAAWSGQPPAVETAAGFPWEADHLYFSVREPWPSTTSATAIGFGKITRQAPLTLVSQMPEHGVIFSDGIESDYLQFNAGSRAVIGVADRKGLLVV